jgi:excisionase family DNA binding protein
MPRSRGPDWVDAPEAARYLSVVRRTWYRMIDEGQLPADRVGRVIRVRWDDIEAFIESCRVRPGRYAPSLRHDVPDDLRKRRRRRPRLEE